MSTTPASTTPAARLVVVDSPAGRPTGRNGLTRCVESIVPALGAHDRLIVVATDRRRAAAATRGQRRVTVLDRPPGGVADILTAVLDGADPSSSVVLVEDHVLALHRRWLDDLTAPLAIGGDASTGESRLPVVAVVPATNGAPWPQCPPSPPLVDAPRRELREWARRMAETGAATVAVQAPAGPVVALTTEQARRIGASAADPSAFETFGAPGTVSALVAALPGMLASTSSGRVVAAPRVYLHATESVPLVSACLIMKNESENLEACLASIRPLADEIVIHDTGSTDDSVELARALGAVVIEGEWRDDFAWARNAALDHARGAWVLSIDLDERLEGNLGAVPHARAHLAADVDTDRFVLDLFNLEGSVHAPVRPERGLRMARLFRRRRCRWVDPIHEQPDRLPGAAPLRTDHLRTLWFVHHGYLKEVMRDRSKVARNLRVAMNELGSLPTSTKACFDLGRSLYMAGQHPQALDLFDRGLELADNRITERACAQYKVLSLLELRRLDDALATASALHAFTDAPGVARYLEGWVRVERHEWTDALASLDGLTEYNDSFTGFSEDRLRVGRALALQGLGRRAAAVDEALAALAHNQQNTHAWRVLLAGGDLDTMLATRIVAALRRDGLVAVFAQLNVIPVAQQDLLAEALWERFPEDRTVLAAVTRIAPRLDTERLLAWEGRLRRNGLGSLAPAGIALGDGTRDLVERLVLAGAAVHRFDADDLRPELERLAAYLPDADIGPLLDRYLDDAPVAADSLVVSIATTATRAVELVAPLTRHGHVEQALAVVSHAASLDAAVTTRLLAGRGALLAELRSAALRLGRDDLGPVLAAA